MEQHEIDAAGKAIAEGARKGGLYCVHGRCRLIETGVCHPGCSFTGAGVTELEFIRPVVTVPDPRDARIAELERAVEAAASGLVVHGMVRDERPPVWVAIEGVS